MTELSKELIESGLKIDSDILTVDEMVDKLCQL
jgi:energy-coupling factor transport system ATP-binding protein